MKPDILQHLPHYAYWCTLALAVVFELMGTTFIREAKGFLHPFAAVKACGCYMVCTALCIVAFAAHIDLSVGYTVWCVLGIGATALIGKYRFGEAFTAMKVVALLLCAAGSVMLVVYSERPEPVRTMSATSTTAGNVAVGDHKTNEMGRLNGVLGGGAGESRWSMSAAEEGLAKAPGVASV
ncbi:hypothetical protein CDCA_CDCA03G1074 [Cyanidium caldarium]|uniref:Uncharacterized protein n=1 Tax=Cyanidium caldarium TaxID=2771 RepID=A0AAV9IRW9_CYACA|nr:hypothetical protein CDCA_CDCA03G1074 [Cyanidium caldarium]